MKKLEIARQVNLLDEAYFLLYQWMNNDELEKSRERYAQYYLSDIDNYNRRIDIILKMYKYVTGNIKTDRERIEYFFKERNPEGSTFASLALLLDLINLSGRIPSYRERVEEIGEARRVKEFASGISGEEAANTPEEKLNTLTDLIAFIEASSYDPASKWEAIKIFNNQEQYYNEAGQILAEAAGLLKDNYAALLDTMAREFYEYWDGYRQDNDLLEVMRDTIKVSWGGSPQGAILAPVIFTPFQLSVTIEDMKDGSRRRDVLRFGVLLDKRLKYFSEGVKKDNIVDIGKILSDKSKVDILELISKKPSYGKEIANELSLSAATISYHVNALLKAGFLHAEVRANKVYYSMNTDRISAGLDEVKEFFTKL